MQGMVFGRSGVRMAKTMGKGSQFSPLNVSHGSHHRHMYVKSVGNANVITCSCQNLCNRYVFDRLSHGPKCYYWELTTLIQNLVHSYPD